MRIWVDEEGARPAPVPARPAGRLRAAPGKTLGVEFEAYGLTARSGRLLEAALGGLATLRDASFLVSRLRVVKSPAELAYVRRAGANWPTRPWTEAVALAGPGAFEGDILAAMQGAVFRAAATIRATSSSSARATARCCAAISPAAAIWTRRTS